MSGNIGIKIKQILGNRILWVKKVQIPRHNFEYFSSTYLH